MYKKNIIPYYEDVNSYDFAIKHTYNEDFDSEAEARVYQRLFRLVSLDDNYYVKYSYWYHPDGSRVYPGGQIDFLVFKKDIGLALIEVKGVSDKNYIGVSIDKACQQLLKANVKLNKDINVYNIVILPNVNLKDAIEGKHIKEKYGEALIVDKSQFDCWNNDGDLKTYFDNFFCDYKKYGIPNPNTRNIIEREINIENYTKDREQIRVAKETILIDFKVKSIDMLADSGYNCFYLTGHAGTGKTFIAMNKALESKKDVLFIVRNEELFKNVFNFFVNNFLIIEKDYVWGIDDAKFRKHSYTVFNKANGNNIYLFLLDINVNSMHYKKDFSIDGDLIKILDKTDLIFVDEIQDANYKEIEMLLKLAMKKNEKTLYFIGDNSQFTNNNTINEFDKMQRLLLDYIKNKLILKLDLKYNNCRNTSEIKNFIYKLVNPTYAYSEKIVSIKVRFLNTTCNLNDNVLDLIIPIRGMLNSKIIFLSDISNDRYSKFITKKFGIKKFEHKISYNLSKGNEYNAVVIMGAEIKNLIDENVIDRNILSLAAGRAKDDLTLVFYINNDEERLHIIEMLKEIYQFDDNCFL